MDDDLINLLKYSKIFSSLDDATRQQLATHFERVELTHDQVLFYQGDPSENIYLLYSGKLSAILTNAQGEAKVVGHIDPGETVGESGALINELRALTIKAVRASVLYKLPSSEFIECCHAHPEVMFATIHPIITRSRSLVQMLSAEKSSKHIAIVAATPGLPLEKFYATLQSYISSLPNLIAFSEYDPELSKPDMDAAALKDKLHELERSKHTTHKAVYLLHSYDSQLAKLCFKKSDVIYIVAHSHLPATLDPSLQEKLSQRAAHFKALPNLILVHAEGILTPRNTAQWLALAQFEMHHHVRINFNKDYQHLIRFIRGRAVGVVLSGGGTRGWAHLGAIKAIRESKIPIDMIGGTSVGAIVAACYAVNESYEDTYERFHQIIEKSRGSVSWRSITWPAISLFDAKVFTQSQIDVFQDILIEDLWLPYFCVSCNLASNTEEIHRRGILWEKTRASSAIPGIIPPMLLNGELHLDGGLLNNLPVDVMREYLGQRSRIIAVELNSYSPDQHKYNFPPILTFYQALLAKLGLSKDKYKFPRFVDTFMHSLFVGSLLKSRQNGMAANTIINLSLNKFRLLHSTPKQAEKLIQMGYESTIEQLHQMET